MTMAHTIRSRVVTYQAPSGDMISLTRPQISKLHAASVWPKDWRGQEFCTVSHGLHSGAPDYSDAGIDALIAAA